jgi:hypothetical protein
VQWLLAIAQLIVVPVLAIAAFVAWVTRFLAVLFHRSPGSKGWAQVRGGYMRWLTRVEEAAAGRQGDCELRGAQLQVRQVASGIRSSQGRQAS